MPVTRDTISCTEQVPVLEPINSSNGLIIPLNTQKYPSPGNVGGGGAGENVKST